MTKKNNKLTAKQKAFVDEYLKDLNATAAYKRAGYTAKGNSAEVNAGRLLRNAQVASAVQSAMDERAQRTQIDADYVLNTIRDTVERCRQAKQATDDEGNTVGEFRFDAQAVLKGCELLGKHLKLFTDKVEVSGKRSFREWAEEQESASPAGS